jgi:hypothetical protein
MSLFTDETNNPATGMSNVVQSLKSWAVQPFQQTMSLTSWFLWTGLIIVFAIAWGLILHEVDNV